MVNFLRWIVEASAESVYNTQIKTIISTFHEKGGPAKNLQLLELPASEFTPSVFCNFARDVFVRFPLSAEHRQNPEIKVTKEYPIKLASTMNALPHPLFPGHSFANCILETEVSLPEYTSETTKQTLLPKLERMLANNLLKAQSLEEQIRILRERKDNSFNQAIKEVYIIRWLNNFNGVYSDGHKYVPASIDAFMKHYIGIFAHSKQSQFVGELPYQIKCWEYALFGYKKHKIVMLLNQNGVGVSEGTVRSLRRHFPTYLDSLHLNSSPDDPFCFSPSFIPQEG